MVKATLWAIIPCLVLIAVHAHYYAVASLLSWLSFFWLSVGFIYTNLFEYWFHRVPLHSKNKLFRLFEHEHRRHHAIFNGEHFTSQNPEFLKYHVITGRGIFAILLLAHYVVALALLPSAIIPAFFFGVTLHFTAYEVTHWLTHIGDNLFDRIIFRIPILRAIRKNQIFHHAMHHDVPIGNFNFNWPFLGDRLYATKMKTLEK